MFQPLFENIPVNGINISVESPVLRSSLRAHLGNQRPIRSWSLL